MKIALILGANPRSLTKGPRVLLAKQRKWGFEFDNVKDSEVKIHIDSDSNPHHAVYQVEVIKRGTEQYISVYAKEEK